MNTFIQEILEGLEYHQTGSRYYGNFNGDSDWDILITDITITSLTRRIKELISEHNWKKKYVEDNLYYVSINNGDVTMYVLESYISSYLNDVITITFINNLTKEKVKYQLLLTPNKNDYYIWIMISNYVKNNIDTITNAVPEYLRVKDFFNILRKYITQKVGETGVDTEFLIKDDKYVTQCVNELHYLFAQLTN